MARLLHHRHTGKRQPHGRTSYGGLTILLILVGFVLVTVGPSAHGETITNNNNASTLTLPGAIGISGTIPAPPPTSQPVIVTPANGSTVATLPVNVTGICRAGLLVSIYANDIMIGSTPCSTTGAFSVPVNLFVGSNVLIARVSDVLDQYGPDSAPVTVSYNAPSLSIPGATVVAHQFFLTTDTPERGGTPHNPLTYGITLVGGVPPFALSVDWGDGKSDLSSRQFGGPVTLSHSYDRPGTYQVTVKGTDASANSAYLQLVTLVNGPVTASTTTRIDPSLALSVWPLYALACLMVLIFYLGERRENYKLRKRHLLVSGA